MIQLIFHLESGFPEHLLLLGGKYLLLPPFVFHHFSLDGLFLLSSAICTVHDLLMKSFGAISYLGQVVLLAFERKLPGVELADQCKA